MIWNYMAAATPQISTGNPLLDSAMYVFGAGAFLLGALAVAIVYLYRENNKKDNRIVLLEDKNDRLQELRLDDLREAKAQQAAPLEELKNFVSVIYEQYRSNNRSRG